MKKVLARLEDTRSKLASIKAQSTERAAARNAALLDGADADAIAKIDAEIVSLQHAERTEADRIILLQTEAAKAQQFDTVKRQKASIARFARKLSEADALAVEMQDDDLPKLLKKYRKIIKLRTEAAVAFPGRTSNSRAAAPAPEGCAMSALAVKVLLGYELYRIFADPFLGGRPGEQREPSLPGAACPYPALLLTPNKIKPFADAMRVASEFAVKLMKDEIGAPGEFTAADITTPAPASLNGSSEPRERTSAEARLTHLLKEQSALMDDFSAAGEARYQQIVHEIANVSAEIDATGTATAPT